MFTNYIFYFLSLLALYSGVMVLLSKKPIHSVLYLTLTFFAIGGHYILLNAQFLAIVHIIVYAGAIMVLFLFTVMLLNIGPEAEGEERRRLRPLSWLGPGLLAAVLLVELGVAIAGGASAQTGARVVAPRAVGVALYGPYAIGVELASTLLLTALIGARHLGQRHRETEDR